MKPILISKSVRPLHLITIILIALFIGIGTNRFTNAAPLITEGRLSVRQVGDITDIFLRQALTDLDDSSAVAGSSSGKSRNAMLDLEIRAQLVRAYFNRYSTLHTSADSNQVKPIVTSAFNSALERISWATPTERYNGDPDFRVIYECIERMSNH